MTERADSHEHADPLSPRETAALYGHATAERALLDSYRAGRLPHGWLLTGQAGIGKATLAYRMARFVLAHPEPAMPHVQRATSLEVDGAHPAARRIAAQAHPDLLVLERTANEKTGKLHQEIQVDHVRRTIPFFGSTPAEGGWRVAIVDVVDELNNYGANALLKILEEPPRRALLLLVSHCAARVLPTIRSRCRILNLRPLAAADVARAIAAATGRDPSNPRVTSAAAAAEGSVRRAVELLDSAALDLRKRVMALLDALPALDPRALHAIGDRIYGTDPATLSTFVDTVNAWLACRLASARHDPALLNRIAEIWQRFNAAASDVDDFNLERKPLVFNVFGWLAEASRG
jgi:DNA polymerase-3 subunit delta'